MLTHTTRWSHPPGNAVVPSPWQATLHRRQPANFSSIDYRLHNPAFSWHLIVSLRDPDRPVIQPFRVQKSWEEFGIDETDDLEDSELAYDGPEVGFLTLDTTDAAESVTSTPGEVL